MHSPLIPVILSGGSGTRLWPVSRKLLPKQFLPMIGSQTMLQQTVLRLSGIPECSAAVLVANHEHRFLAAEQMNEVGAPAGAILLEPVSRGTAPAAAAAALVALDKQPDAQLLVLAADHFIGQVPVFQSAVARARAAAADGFLVTFGIKPTAPETGYGYIEMGEPIPEQRDVRRIRRFVEKPDAATARSFVDSGEFVWNAGMFVFGAKRYLEELERHRPEMLDAVRRSVEASTRDLDFMRLDLAAFSASPSDSIDRAVMERTSRGAVVEGAFGWADVGSWSSIWALGTKDERGNVSQGDVALTDAQDCYIRADGRHVSLLGVKDLVVIDTDDAILVASRQRAQDVKEVVAKLEHGARTEHVSHTRVYRPWGYYESLDSGAGFQVKRLMVKPGQSLSFQRHRQRAEHWVVVSGRARVTRDHDAFELYPNQSTYIPIGAKHRLENAGDAPLFVIEVQSGDYLGEDDIERFDDRYNRS